MRTWDPKAEEIMKERFGRNRLIALATAVDGIPYVRNVTAYYEGGSFYIITDARSEKMKQIAKNPTAAVAGEWFEGHGTCVNLGYFGAPENRETAEKLGAAFGKWIHDIHVDLSDENTVLLRVKLTDGKLLSDGTKYEI